MASSSNPDDAAKLHSVLFDGGKMLEFVLGGASCVLKRRAAVLSNFTKELSSKDKRLLKNSTLFHMQELLLSKTLTAVAKMSHRTVHKAAIRKAISQRPLTPAPKPKKPYTPMVSFSVPQSHRRDCPSQSASRL